MRQLFYHAVDQRQQLCLPKSLSGLGRGQQVFFIGALELLEKLRVGDLGRRYLHSIFERYRPSFIGPERENPASENIGGALNDFECLVKIMFNDESLDQGGAHFRAQAFVFALKVPQRDHTQLQSFEIPTLAQYIDKPGVLDVLLKDAVEAGV